MNQYFYLADQKNNLKNLNKEIKGYQIIKELGRGFFGVTYLAKKNNKLVAIKQIPLTNNKEYLAVKNEFTTLRKISELGCKYTVCYIEVFYYDKSAYIVTNYLEGLELYKLMKSELDIKILKPIMLQLILGLKQIHDAGFAHRDIKADNIILTKEFQIKYIDFGLACYQQCKPTIGALAYLPPEFYLNKKINTLAKAQAQDIWALSILFYEFANGLGSFNYHVFEEPGFNYETKLGNPPNYYVEEINEFIEFMIVLNPKFRPKIDTVLKEFVTKVLISD